jgi:transcriptional regulator with XRE-family HTH domain
MMNTKTIGQLIKKYRMQKGMTQEELAERTNLSVRTIQRIENGIVDPRAYTLRTIASALEVDYQQFIGDDEAALDNVHSNESSLWLPLLHLSGLFILLIPPVIIWIWKRDQVEHVREQGVDVINFQLSMLMILMPAGILSVLLITIPIVILVALFSSIVIVVNTIKVMNNQPYQYPLSVRILKP